MSNIVIGLEYHRNSDVAVARFLQYRQPITQTYSITPDRYVAIFFDSQWAGRIASVQLNQAGTLEAEQSLIHLFGADFAAMMLNARRLGLLVTAVMLTTAQQRRLALLQADSPATPPLLRKVSALQAYQLGKDIHPSIESI